MYDIAWLNRALSDLTGVKKETFDSISGNLRQAGMVSAGSRGLNALPASPEDVKNIILGLLGSDNASRAARVVKKLSDLKSPETGRTAGEAIVDLLTNPDALKGLGSIRVTRNYPMVEIYWACEEEPVGCEEIPSVQREEIFKGTTPVPSLQIKAILSGSVLETIVIINRWIADQGENSNYIRQSLTLHNRAS